MQRTQTDETQSEKTFLHDAHGIGFAGVIRRPFQELIEVQGATAVPSSGGYGHAYVEKYSLKNLIHFDWVRTVVTGSDNGGANGARVWNTLATTTIKNLNIAGQVTADLVVAHLNTRYSLDDELFAASALGSRFEGLKIGGQLMDVDWTLSEHTQDPDPNKPNTRKVEAALIPTITSLFPPAHQPTFRGCRVDKDNRVSVEIKNFGVVHLSEMSKAPFHRRVTMLRVELGCPIEGSITGGEVSDSGRPFPPD